LSIEGSLDIGMEIAHGRDEADALPLETCDQHTSADFLGQHEFVPHTRRRIAHHVAGIDHTRHRQPILELRVFDGMAAEQHGTSLDGLRQAAFEDLEEMFVLQPLRRKIA
jgi:hypothetical protein